MSERRNIELRSDGKRLIGYAAVFNLPSLDLGGFQEVVAPGAFTRSLSANPDVVALWDHDARSVLGRTKSGTLRLSQDTRGLRFEIDAPNTTTGTDVLEMVGRGDVTGASFAFTVKEQRWRETDALPVRELLDVDLLDVTRTPSPAYPDTDVARRNFKTAGFMTRGNLAHRQREILIMELSL